MHVMMKWVSLDVEIVVSETPAVGIFRRISCRGPSTAFAEADGGTTRRLCGWSGVDPIVKH